MTNNGKVFTGLLRLLDRDRIIEIVGFRSSTKAYKKQQSIDRSESATQNPSFPEIERVSADHDPFSPNIGEYVAITAGRVSCGGVYRGTNGDG